VQRGGARSTDGFRGRARTTVALVLLVAAALAATPATVAKIRRTLAEYPEGGDHLSRFERRMRPVREQLQHQFNLERVGYLPPMALRSDQIAWRTNPHFLWTRYSLAPVQLLPTWETEAVFADLRALRSDPAATIPVELKIEKDFGDGMLLLRRRQQ
jgi:hypothetical protein